MTDEVILAEVYIKGGEIGIHFTGEGCRAEVCYFLESFCKTERYDYERAFRFHDKGGNVE